MRDHTGPRRMDWMGYEDAHKEFGICNGRLCFGGAASIQSSFRRKADLIGHWKKRWLIPRKENAEVRKNVTSFCATDFKIE